MMKNSKEFDAVKMMRNIRDEISREIQGMNFEEQKRYIQKRVQIKSTAEQRIQQKRAV